MTPTFSPRVLSAPASAFNPRLALARHAAALHHTLPWPLTKGNRIELLPHGAGACRALFDAVDSARDHLNIQGELVTGAGPRQELARRLALKRRQGVKVNLLAEPAGPLMVVDGRVAFAAGLRAEGPVVAQLQQGFIDDWVAQAGQRPYLAHFFPRQLAAGSVRSALACEAALQQALELAQDRISIASPGCVPLPRLLRALLQAAQRGVSVTLLLPGKGDARPAWQAAHWHYRRLLKAGVRIFERQRALLPAGMAVIDGLWSTVGAFPLGDSPCAPAGAKLLVLDERFGAGLEAVFADQLHTATAIAPPAWPWTGIF